MKKLKKIKCECGKTIAFKIDDSIEIKCKSCGRKNTVIKQTQFEEAEIKKTS